MIFHNRHVVLLVHVEDVIRVVDAESDWAVSRGRDSLRVSLFELLAVVLACKKGETLAGSFGFVALEVLFLAAI